MQRGPARPTSVSVALNMLPPGVKALAAHEDSEDLAEVLNVRLRGTFARVLPDWKDGRVRLRWIGGEDCAESLVFAWPKGETG
jgi:hypothetical protein